MGLVDFLKPKKDPMAELLQQPAMRGAMVEMELEYLQKQVANLRNVGRKDDAKQALRDFLLKYVKEGRGESISRLELARISYSLAYRFLPGLIFSRWNEFCDLWSGGVPFPVYLAITGANGMGKRLSMKQVQEFKYYQGDLSSDMQYFLIQFPVPPSQGKGPGIDSMMAALEKGQGLSRAILPVLGPYFAAIIYNSSNGGRHFYILGQSPVGGRTTLRFVTWDGVNRVNANCGAGPDATASGFLEAVKAHLDGPEAAEPVKREQKPVAGEAAHRASPPPVTLPRSPKEAGPEQAPSLTLFSFGNERGNGSTWRLFGYVTAPVVCLLVVLAILSSFSESSRPGPSPTPNASPTKSPRPGPSPTPNASPTESSRPGPSPTPNASPTESPRPGPSPAPNAKPKYRVQVPSGGFLNMRQGPRISFSVVQRLQNGVDGVTLIGKPVTNGSTRWQQISSRGVVGWVNADYLVPSEGLPPGFAWETAPAPGATPTPSRNRR